MLVLSRKVEQTILIGSDIVVTVVAVNGNRVKLGIAAPKNVRILRKELLPYDFGQWDESGIAANCNGDQMHVLESSTLTAR